jgi:cold shock CspA family protein
VQLPHSLIQDIRDGNAVLVLGAGASLEAQDSAGRRPPSGWQLARGIAKQFLGDGYDDYPLNEIAELAINEASLPRVQDFIVEQFRDIPPSPTHLELATFRWRGVATTNYDDLLEQAYATCKSPAQNLIPFRENGERIDLKLRQANALAYLKLHGCVSQPHREDLPFILTIDQYIEHRRNRSRLFAMLKEWATEYSLLFVGYTLKDSTLRTVLLELTNSLAARERFYMVLPSFTDAEKRLWESKRVTPLEGTASDLASALCTSIQDTFRGARPTTAAGALAISERFAAESSLSQNCIQFLEGEVDYVRRLGAQPTIVARDFYLGLCPIWPAIERELDVQRRLKDTLLADCFVADDAPQIGLVLVLGHAGSGKSVLLHRLAWDAARHLDCLCLFLRDGGVVNAAAIREIATASDERIFVFVDDAIVHASELHRAIQGLRDTSANVTFVSAARTNEWNSYDGSLRADVTEEASLHYLSEPEIDALLGLLEANDALLNLAPLSPEERRDAFVRRAGRQLLVALYEATHGKSFEDIICDEYKRITPIAAQEIYRSVCVLNRFGVPVRAGVISRIHGVPFERFRQRFLGPLEGVVKTIKDPGTGDMAYAARHRQIAEIVFLEALGDAQDRYDEYMRCLQHLNVDYASDRRAFNQMIRGRILIDMFSDPSMVKAIYDCAECVSVDDPLVFHQRAIWEINRPSGDLAKAATLLSSAMALDSRNVPIVHTTAELALRRAKLAVLPAAAARHLDDAEEICRGLVNRAHESHARHTLVKVAIERLRLELKDDEGEDDAKLTKMLASVERELSRHLAAVPGDSYLLAAEADLAELLAETKRAKASLQKAFAKDKRSTYVALALARCHWRDDEFDAAKAVLVDALDANPTDQRLHNLLCVVLWESGKASDNEIKHHAKRAYSPGDRNYVAQLLYARQVYVTESPSAASSLFQQLKRARVGFEAKTLIKYPLPDQRHGEIASVEANYCFIRDDETGDRIFVHEDNFNSGQWQKVQHGSSVSFRLGFSLNGAAAFDVAVVDG